MKFYKAISPCSMVLVLFLSFSVNTSYCKEKEGDKGRVTNKVINAAGESYRLNINNINLPLNRVGVLADVSIATPGIPPDIQKGGVFDNQIFLYSAGFFLSGKDAQNNAWTNGVASALNIQDYVSGPFGKDNDPKAQLYVVSSGDAHFSQSWQDWKNAVDMGANFYDGDGDGVYNPIDKNGNGLWDPDEDRPDLIGDKTVWCVYNDNVPAAQRTYNDVNPQGIEIRQTVYAFNSNSIVGNVIFVRYEIENKGTSQVLDSVYFSAWADPDLGTPSDDLDGCDTLLNAGYTYNNGSDGVYGSNPPSALIGLLQGPASFIPGVTFIDANGNGKYDAGETVLQSAYEINGKYRGVKTIPGAKNLSMSSFVHYLNGDLTINDPRNQYDVRNYQLGLDRAGHQLNPCNWALGHVFGVDCNLVNKNFWYSGDPTLGQGWVNTSAKDQRNMLNVGPFKLEKTKPVSVVVAYVVGRGTNALNSLTVAKDIDVQAQLLCNNNFTQQNTPYKPILLNPANGSAYQGTSLKLTWSLISNADSYRLQVAKDSGFTNMIFDDSTLTTNNKTVNNLLLNTSYYWRVSAKNSFGKSDYSNIWSFSTKVTDVSGEQNAIPTEYGFYQNYPNPFNPSTVIKYDLPKEGFVTIKIYNILGKEIKTLVNDFKRAGSYNVTFDAGNLPSGIYFCRIKSNDFSAVRKLLLIK